MKKNVFWISASLIMFVVLPLMSRSDRQILYIHEALLLLFIPLFFVILGISVSREIKKHWFLPVCALALFFAGEELITDSRWRLDYITVLILMVIYLVLEVVSMLLSSVFFRVSDRKTLLKKSLVFSGIVSGAGFLVNLFSYIIFKNIPFGITLWGGEYSGKRGFGLLLNRLHPMTMMGEAAPRNNSWLSFDPISLLITFVFAFVLSLTFLLIRAALQNRGSGRKQSME